MCTGNYMPRWHLVSLLPCSWRGWSALFHLVSLLDRCYLWNILSAALLELSCGHVLYITMVIGIIGFIHFDANLMKLIAQKVVNFIIYWQIPLHKNLLILTLSIYLVIFFFSFDIFFICLYFWLDLFNVYLLYPIFKD